MTWPFTPAFPVQVWPSAASVGARHEDLIFVVELAISVLMVLLIFGAILFFAIKYRRRLPTERPRPIRGGILLELGWTVIPLLVFMVFFVWGAAIFFSNADAPKDAMRIYVVGKQWMWYVQHPTGQREINQLHVPAGRDVQLVITSQDVIHSFFIPAFRIKKDAVPGMYTTEWFHPTDTGSYHLFCTQYCGAGHSHMIGTVYVLKPAEYQQWLAGGRGESMAAAGQKLYKRYGCINCHGVICPSLDGLYGKQVPLADGHIVLADEAYLRESILDPGSKIVAGYPNLMPSFRGVLSELEVLNLIAYIRSLGTPALAGEGTGLGAGQGTGTAAGRAAPDERQQQGNENAYPPSSNPHTRQGERSDEVHKREGGDVREPQ